MKQIIIVLFIMLFVACNQQPIQVTVKMDTPRDTVYVEKIIYKDSRTIAKGMGSAELDKALGIVDTTIHKTQLGSTWQRVDDIKGSGKVELLKALGVKCNDNKNGIMHCESANRKWVTIDDTTSTYICKYNNGWKCSKGSKDDPLGILN